MRASSLLSAAFFCAFLLLVTLSPVWWRLLSPMCGESWLEVLGNVLAVIFMSGAFIFMMASEPPRPRRGGAV